MEGEIAIDTSIVELHRLSGTCEPVLAVEGGAVRVGDDSQPIGSLQPGSQVRVGETIALEPGAEVRLACLVLSGGRRGRAHSFVAKDAFPSSPSTKNVQDLLAQLSHIERQMDHLGEDPLAMQRGPSSVFEHAVAADFARANLVRQTALALPESIAREVGAVCLFASGEAVFVALSALSIAKVRRLMKALDRPVNPHLVGEGVLEELLRAVYGGAVSSPS